MSRALACGRLRVVSDLATSVVLADECLGTERLSAQWWVKALARHERSCALQAGSLHSPRPAWVDTVEQAVAVAEPLDAPVSMESWQEAFAGPLRPFVTVARGRLAEGAGRHLAAGHSDVESVADTFVATLEKQLAGMAVRTLVVELDAASAGNRLQGCDGRQRLEDFLQRLCTPGGLVALLGKYPVLARLLGSATLLAAEAGLELLARLAADRAVLVEILLGGVDPGPVVAIEPGLGDQHARGRSVTAISFADGRKVIYKPRAVESCIWFREVIGWLNQRVPLAGLRAALTVVRAGYGWQEFIASQPLSQPGEAAAFYRREGLLLAALYALHASDIHCENVIASADQPVLVDVEALFHPSLPVLRTVADPAADMLAISVYRAGLLPYVIACEGGVIDRSGIGGDAGEAWPDAVLDWDPPATDQMRLIRRPGLSPAIHNRPHCQGHAIEPANYEDALLQGFQLGYNAIAEDRQAFTRLIESCSDGEVRVVVRPTRAYRQLLDESTHPDLLRDARDRDEALDVLHEVSVCHPLWRQLVQHELADLWNGDIPLMTSRPAARDIWTSTGHRLPGLLDRAGMSSVRDKVAAMGAMDRRDQEWIISASMAVRRSQAGHRSIELTPGPVTATAAEPGSLLAAACGLADQIVACGKTCRDEAGRHRGNWLGLQLVEDARWFVLPMGAGLADGYLGVALFLAQLADLTGIRQYAQEARRALSPVPHLLMTLTSNPDLLAAVGCGAAEGVGGISYGLARLATLLDDAELREWAESAVELAGQAVILPGPPGWTPGIAGCLAAMSAVQAELGSAAAGNVARECAGLLVSLVNRTSGRCADDGDPVPQGFAAGPAGIGWALARYAAIEADSDCLQAGHCALRYAGESLAGALKKEAHGWCSGTAGLLLARCMTHDTNAAEIQLAVRLLTGRPLLRDLSLCHGELGIADALTVVTNPRCGDAACGALRHRAGLILDLISRQARYCGTPGGIPTPGLLSGLAGIGYGLLRLGFGGRVPSVLLLEPTPATSLSSVVR